ncbi:MAG: arginine--tRNA ligase [Micavibrio sp.]
MMSLIETLSDITGAAFAAEGLPAEMGAVRVSDRPDLAQFQCNGAMAAAKAAKKNPRTVAEAVVARLRENPIFAKIEIAGPGFINLTLTDEALAEQVKKISADPRYGVVPIAKAETIILDYGGPNVAKHMHVGHLRSSIIGDSLRRTLVFAGYDAKGDVHLGDWGTPMGMLLDHPGVYQAAGSVDMNDAEAVARFVDFLGVAYPEASAAFKESPEKQKSAQQKTVLIQNRDPDYYGRWRTMREASVAVIRKNFESLGVSFDLWEGESDVHDVIAPMVADLQKKNFAVEDDGAIVVHVKREDDDKEYPPLILYKRDGAVMYGTTDLATIVERIQKHHPAKILYVVDQRQGLHFEQVFRAARLSGLAPDSIELTHAGFGTMNGADGKPFKTRAGGVMKLEDLIGSGIEKAEARLKEANLAQDMDAAEQQDVARKIAIAAIKFADLQNQRQSDYIFDLDRMTSFEGKTGPYMLYQAVRIKSLLRKAEAQGDLPGDTIILKDEDRALALLSLELPETMALALRHYTPHVLCDYAYRLANAFSSFYGNCHILSEPDSTLKASRLRLCAMVMGQLILVLDLLGIEIPERM